MSMQYAPIKSIFSPPKWLRFLILILLVLGIFFRFVNLDQKIYTTDEVRTLLRASGYISSEFVERTYNTGIIGVEDLQKYQRPNQERTLSDAIKAFAGNPEHPPLYYILARFWLQWFYHPVAARILAVVISFFVFPCLYWLCFELFQSSLTSWFAIALFAVSPFHILLSQEAREYSLWTVATLLSSAALLAALRTNAKANWGIYFVSISLGFYSHLFFTWVAIAHGFYVLLDQKFKPTKKLLTYILTSTAGFLTFTPWILVIFVNFNDLHKATKWARSSNTDIFQRAKDWLQNLSNIFISSDFNNSIEYFIQFSILVLTIYSMYFLYQRSPKTAFLFIMILFGVTASAQVIPDLLLGGKRSLVPRYLLLSYLGLQIAIAYLLTNSPQQLWKQKLWKLVFVVLISLSTLSSAINAQTNYAGKGEMSINSEAASIINQASDPLVVSDDYFTRILSLSHLLTPKVKLQLTTELESLKISSSSANIFAYSPSQKLRAKLEQQQFVLVPLLFDPHIKTFKLWAIK